MWFKVLTGFQEESPTQVRKNLSVTGEILKSHINDKEYSCGLLETPSLAELRERVAHNEDQTKKISVREVVADVQQLHIESANAGSLFQVASQFNLLEMVSPNVTPEQGVSDYEYDRTQGPACAIAAGAGTIYRNYFAKVHGEIGQTTDNQIDCLANMGEALGNSDNRLWQMRNGYALASEAGLIKINHKIKSASEAEIDELRKLLRIGIQWNTEVTLHDAKHSVTQTYCSALPVAYSQQSPMLWAEFARIVLEASYEATICAGILNSQKTGNNKVYLTLLGGGAFGNESTWIVNAIERSLKLYRNAGLDVVIVSYGYSNPHIQALIHQVNNF
ncbi:hypothetical protein [Candidatus Venteria ishoeyi]|uniref:Uncharacterized protein n=1 Tax=Candidatus Venteria ishoeyi TaxID=1899563 RepID=A0A1H6FF88_9GAMM|nr:hypothetical protein [Candidatus Venteria ishoeyi]SEH08748.1 Uncharacterised protein [Candidatus Venteria ishoeyi]